jgi:membrane AbrB-like protein
MAVPTADRIGHWLFVYSGALALGVVGDWIRLPLPWLIGAIVFAAALRLSDRKGEVPPVTRPIGQVLIAAAVGLAFTPEALAAVAQLIVPMVAAAVLTVAAGFAVAFLLARLAGIGLLHAVLASVPMGPVESANLARRYGVPPASVILAQTMRIVALVLVIPPVLVALDGSIRDPSLVLRDMPWNAGGTLLLILCATLAAFTARRVGLSNPFFVGALAGAAAAAAADLPVTGLPYPVLIAAQVFLGVWLGAVFDRTLLLQSRSFIPAALICTALMMVICALLGLALVPFTGLGWQVLILATAPGSVTEMALTAKILQDGIAVVTAFHLVRIFLILPFAPVIARAALRWAGDG